MNLEKIIADAVTAALFAGKKQSESSSDNFGGFIGKNVIIRTYSAGVWFGDLSEKSGSEVILKNARRMWKWKAKEGISLSACALYGVDGSESKIVEPVASVWLDVIEIIECSEKAINSISGAPNVKAQ